MPRFLCPLVSCGFVSGMTGYRDSYPGQEHVARVVVPIRPEGYEVVEAIVDTASPWCVLDPQIAEELCLSVQACYCPETKLKIRGMAYRGRLLRMRMTLLADVGNDLEIEATVFIPALAPGQTWHLPNFIGLNGFLDRIRFAVDPKENAFYHGTA